MHNAVSRDLAVIHITIVEIRSGDLIFHSRKMTRMKDNSVGLSVIYQFF